MVEGETRDEGEGHIPPAARNTEGSGTRSGLGTATADGDGGGSQHGRVGVGSERGRVLVRGNRTEAEE
jgi:hypothetical protein